MKKRSLLSFFIFLFCIVAQAQKRDDGTSWKMLFDIHDAPYGVQRDAKITARQFKRLAKTPTVWQRDLQQVKVGIGYEWTEEIHVFPNKKESIIFITTEPTEFERLLGLLTEAGQKDEFGVIADGEGFTPIGEKTLSSGRVITRFQKEDRVVEVLSNQRGAVEEWIFQLSKTDAAPRDVIKPVITVISPEGIQSKSLGETVLEKTRVTIKITDESGIKSVIFDGKPVVLDRDGMYSQVLLLAKGVKQKQVAIVATDNQGNTSSLLLTVTGTSPIAQTNKQVEADMAEVGKGRYYALIVSVQDYQPGIPSLFNPHNDADALVEVLSTRYKFEKQDIIRLKDPKLSKLGEVFEDLRKRIGNTDNLLIFFSGHGEWDKEIQRGYWLLKDAEPHNRVTWLSNSTLKDYISVIGSRHTLLVTDACFAGSIFKSKAEDYQAEEVAYQRPSRVAITSELLAKVPDRSVFMTMFLKSLKTNGRKYLSAQQFFLSFSDAVKAHNKANPQLPQYRSIDDSGHFGGDFIFTLR